MGSGDTKTKTGIPAASANGASGADLRKERYRLSALVVDDDAFCRQVMTGLLESIGIRANEAANAHEAIDSLSQKYADLLFVDIHLDGIRGDELCKKVRSQFRKDQYGLVVAITGGSGDFDRGPEHGDCFDGVLYKPFDRDGLLALVKKLGVRVDPDYACEGYIFEADAEAIMSLLPNLGIPREGLPDMLSRYIGSFIVDFDHAFAKNDISKCQQLAHRIKGSMGFIGAALISAKAKELEQICIRRDERAEIADSYRRLTALLESLIRGIKQVLA